MKRQLQPEILDGLAADDPRAIQARRDLRKVNAFMGHAGLVERALRAQRPMPRRIVELGAGDGSLLLKVATRLGRAQAGVRAVLVDRAPTVSARTLSDFRALGWEVVAEPADVFDWLMRPGPEHADMMLANLFLHHFDEGELSTLFAAITRQTTRFIACEPRRSRTALAGASLLFLLGCNDVTRHDADVSVRAGFRDAELSQLWPNEQGWRLEESRAGLFSHFLAATHV